MRATMRVGDLQEALLAVLLRDYPAAILLNIGEVKDCGVSLGESRQLLSNESVPTSDSAQEATLSFESETSVCEHHGDGDRH